MIIEEEREALQKEFEEQKKISYAKICKTNKASGRNGLTMGFYMKC